MSTLLRIERGKRPQAGRNLRGRAREIGADRLPALAAVQRLEDDVRTQVEHARVDRREHHGHGADRKSVVKGKSVDLGGRRIIKKKKGRLLYARRLWHPEDGTGRG